MSLSTLFEFIPTKRKGIKLLYDGRQYHNRKKYVNGNGFWQCYNKKGCGGNITLTKENDLLKEKAHDIDCLPNPSKNMIIKRMDTLKTKISNNLDPIQKQFEEMICELQDEGVHFTADLPEFKNIKSGLYNARHSKMGVSKLHFQSPQEVTIPKKYESFLLADYNDVEIRISVFCSLDIEKKLNSFQHFFLDGTFKSCPLPFKQIYTIHGLNTATKTIIPLFFAFTHSKNVRTYEIILQLIKSRLPHWKPTKMTLDYEKAAMKAIQNVFPDTEIKGCYYHYCNNLFRYGKRLGIKTRVQKRHIARCAGLARLPLKYVTSGYKYVMSRAPKSDVIIKFNDYLTRTWFMDLNCIKRWCCYGEEVRTTNNLEGWHARLNKYVGCQNPSLAKVLDILVKEAKISCSKKPNKKSNTYEEIDNEIALAIEDLEEKKITVGHCLEIIAPFY